MITFEGPIVLTIRDEKLFLKSGDVGRWCTGLGREFSLAGKAAAPTGATKGYVNKTSANAGYPVGSLKAGTDAEVTQRGTKRIRIDMVSTAPYTIFVIKGTKAVRPGKFQERNELGQFASGEFSGGMVLPANKGFSGKVPIFYRRGQRANNFLKTGYDAVAARHAALPVLSRTDILGFGDD